MLLLGSVLLPIHAEEVIEIYDVQDLLQIKENPNGSYILMQDLDCEGLDWTPHIFTGDFNGNNHALLNLNIQNTDTEKRKTYDGNMIDYDTVFSGFFSILENAKVYDLSLYNSKINIEEDSPIFIGALAGYSSNSTIDNCTITSRIQLNTKAPSFGISGAIGFGEGELLNSKIETTLIEVDDDIQNKDEQFLGGALASGYLDIDNCEVKINGYVSEHGYAHNGGLVGMYIIHTDDKERDGFITNNYVDGQISFFEDNEDRRAYCEDFLGEIMNYSFAYDGNGSYFERNEIFEYDTNLTDEVHDKEDFEETVVESTHEDFGYTEYHCTKCDHIWKDHYTLPAHTASSFEVVREATDNKPGIEKGICDECGQEFYQELTESVDNTEIEDIPTSEDVSTSTDIEVKETSILSTILKILLIVVLLLVILFCLLLLYGRRKRIKRYFRRKFNAKK